MRAKEKSELWSHYINDNRAEIKTAMANLYRKQNPFRVDLYLFDDGEFLEFVNVGGNNWLESDQEYVVVYSCNFEYSESLDYRPYDLSVDGWMEMELQRYEIGIKMQESYERESEEVAP